MMKKIILPLCIMSISLFSYAQKDSSFQLSADVLSKAKPDTIRIGDMIIINDKTNKGTYEIGRGMIKVNLNSDDRIAPKSIRADKRVRYYDKGVTIYSSIGSDRNTDKNTLVNIRKDTVQVGRIQIINKDESEYNKDLGSLLDGEFKKTKITYNRRPKQLKNTTTSWLEFDLGFTNLIDKTPTIAFNAIYMPSNQSFAPVAVTNTNLKLNNPKSSNVNIWIVQQKTNLYKHYLNLKYGLGIEMYNFRFEQPISFGNTPGNYVYFDNVHFSKNKLFVEYLTVPIQLNFQSDPGNNKSFYASLGMSAGYLLESRTKQISEERGKKKVGGNFNLNNYKMAVIGELGIGGIRVYGSYSMTNLFDKKLTYFDMAPFVIGLRLSKF